MQKLCFTILCSLLVFGGASFLKAQSADALKTRIQEKNIEIERLEKEIRAYEASLKQISTEAGSLKNELARIDLERKKILSDIQATEAKISKATLTIQELSSDIEDREGRVGDSIHTIAESIRNRYIQGTASLPELFLNGDSLGKTFERIDAYEQLEEALHDHVELLRDEKVILAGERTNYEAERKELEALRKELDGQKRVVDANKAEKDALLKQTQNQEAAYQKLIQDKIAARNRFEAEIQSLESELQLIIDAGKLPKAGSGVLKWPLDNVYITQYFGNTAFATQNPQIYKTGGHNGIDMGTSVGTNVKTALSGIVVETGNTDAKPGCYSWGKWIVVKHPNGLSTLYAHLSAFNVKAGDSVITGDIIGWSGNTGISTGPHLHFTVYATEGMRIVPIPAGPNTNCAGVRVPLADPKAYLNPLSYL